MPEAKDGSGASDKSKEQLLTRLGEIYDDLKSPEYLRRIVSGRLKEAVVPLIEERFEPGDRFAFEQLISVSTPAPVEIDSEDVWNNLSQDNRLAVLNQVGDYFGVDLVNIHDLPKVKVSSDKVKRATDREEVEISVLNTSNPLIDVWVIHYEEPEFGIQYSLVRTEGN